MYRLALSVWLSGQSDRSDHSDGSDGSEKGGRVRKMGGMGVIAVKIPLWTEVIEL